MYAILDILQAEGFGVPDGDGEVLTPQSQAVLEMGQVPTHLEEPQILTVVVAHLVERVIPKAEGLELLKVPVNLVHFCLVGEVVIFHDMNLTGVSVIHKGSIVTEL